MIAATISYIYRILLSNTFVKCFCLFFLYFFIYFEALNFLNIYRYLNIKTARIDSKAFFLWGWGVCILKNLLKMLANSLFVFFDINVFN